MIEPNLRTPPADTSAQVTDSYIKAVNLNRRIITAAQLAQQSLYDMCMGFKEMRDSKLYKELGYADFADYCENETGIKRRQVYSYIQVAEKLPDEFVQSTAQIGVQKLYLLSSLSEQERTEITQVTDLESTSVRELEQQIKQIRAEKDKAVADKSAAEAEASASAQQAKALEKAKEQLSQQIHSLEAEIKELESRPVEVAVQELPEGVVDAETFRNICKTYDEQADKLQEEALQNTIRLNQEHTAEIEKIKTEYEQKLAEAAKSAPSAPADDKDVFKAYLANALDALERLVAFIGKSSGNIGLYKSKTLELLTLMKGKCENEG